MRVLLLGSPNHDKIAQALRKEHYLYDFMANPEKEAAGIPEGVYDAAILLADRTDNQFAVQLSRTLCALREGGASLPVLVVASHLSARDRVLALDAGADDVLTAPFLMGELLARVRALSRRGPALQPRQLCAGDLTLDRGHCMLRSRGGEIRLSGKEMQIVELFRFHLRHASLMRGTECIQEKLLPQQRRHSLPGRCCPAPPCSTRSGGWTTNLPITTLRCTFRSSGASCAPSALPCRSTRSVG